MDWSHIAQVATDALEIALILRLLTLRLHSVYRVFCVFLFVEVVTSGLALWIHFAQPRTVDYRVVWLSFAPIEWTLYLVMVYVLLNALLSKFPGILRVSRKILHVAFVAAGVIGIVSARPEYLVHERVIGAVRPIDRMVSAGLVTDRVISMVALLALVATLAFILWFPVQMPRNLAVFSIGFVIFFAAQTSLLVAYSFGSYVDLDILNMTVLFVLSACLFYWLLFINKAGEEAPARIGHSWNAVEQQRLIAQLEAMNATLLRAARR